MFFRILFCSVFGSTWVHQREPKSIKNRSKIEVKIHQIFHASWAPIFGGFWWILGPKIEASWLSKSSPKRCYLQKVIFWKNLIFPKENEGFWRFGGWKLGPKIDEKLIKNSSKNILTCEGILAPIFLRFWWIWEAKLASSWHQNTIKNGCEKLIDFAFVFWSILVPFWASTWGYVGAWWSPWGPQEAFKTSQEALKLLSRGFQRDLQDSQNPPGGSRRP